MITQGSKKETGGKTTLHTTVAIYYGFLNIEIEEITCQLLQGCDLQFYLFEEEYKDSIGPLVTQPVHMDKGEELTDYIPPLKGRKKTKHTSAHIVQLTPNQPWRATYEIDMNEHQNHAIQDRSLYTKFSEQLSTQGNIKWHLHDKEAEICIMNDVDKDTVFMKPNSFVHVTYTTDESC